MSQANVYCSNLQFYNAEREAIGYYIRTADDKMTATIKYFDFPGFHGNTTIEDDITKSGNKKLTANSIIILCLF
jgi:hypothetical protein